VAPLKALCTEKFNEWSEKFEKLHSLKCIELTGDTDHANENDFEYVQNSNIIFTTPVRDFFTSFFTSFTS
jgi:ATP-dependent DNA helicase HFM1/MER3